MSGRLFLILIVCPLYWNLEPRFYSSLKLNSPSGNYSPILGENRKRKERQELEEIPFRGYDDVTLNKEEKNVNEERKEKDRADKNKNWKYLNMMISNLRYGL